MDNAIKELGRIRNSIISGKISERELRALMNKVEEEYGENVFKEFDLNAVRQYVYSQAYYKRLIQLAKNGACSQEFYIHLLHVRDAIKKEILKKILILSGVFVLSCIEIVNFVLLVKNNIMLQKFFEKEVAIEFVTSKGTAIVEKGIASEAESPVNEMLEVANEGKNISDKEAIVSENVDSHAEVNATTDVKSSGASEEEILINDKDKQHMEYVAEE